MAEDEGEIDNGGVLMEQEEAQVDEGEERTPFYVLSEEAIALFARSDERRRKEKNRVRPQTCPPSSPPKCIHLMSTHSLI
jgi:hypothetical protein